MDTNMRVKAVVDLGAIRDNMISMKKNMHENARMAAVIKTDAYGHGAVQVAGALEDLPFLWGYCVATFEEAQELRQSGIKKPILILGYTFPYCYAQLVEEEIRPVVFRKDTLKELDETAARMGRNLAIHVALDTGMSRIGVKPDDSGIDFMKAALACKNLTVEGIFTHFARADEESGRDATQRQFDLFASFNKRVEEELGYHIPIQDCSNSAGIITYPQYNEDMARAGITMYGLWPSDEVSRDIVALKPAMSIYSHIAYIKEIDAGTPVSYGGIFTAPQKMTIATIPVGYGDGYPRSLSNKGYVLIHGKRAHIVGRVCMDQFMVSLEGIPEAKEGDLVTIMGRDGDETITAEDSGRLSGRFNYEFVCDLSEKRVPREYIR